MDTLVIFAVVAAVVGLGFLSELVFKKTNIPDVLILILLGIFMKQWVSPDSFGDGTTLFTTFALVFILFQGALNIDFRALLKSLGGALGLTVLSFILTTVVATGIASLIVEERLLALLIGIILGGTSSAVVIPIVRNINVQTKTRLVLTLESAISDVLVIVGALTVINIYETQQIVASGIVSSVLTSFSLAIVVGGLVGVVWIVLMNKFKALSKAYMVSIAVVIALYALVESQYVGASGAIAALSFGLVMGNSQLLLKLIAMSKANGNEDEEYSDMPEDYFIRNVVDQNARNFYQEIGFFVKVFFFVYLGMLIDFSNPTVFLYGAILTLGIYFVRPLAVKIVFWKGTPEKDRTMLEVLIPKGLAAAVLVQVAVQRGVPAAAEMVNLVLSVVFLSILFTSILAFMTERGWFTGLWDLFKKKTPAPTKKE